MFLLNILVSIALMILGYIIMPKTKTDSTAITEMEDPTAEAGKDVPVVFGDDYIQSMNLLGFWDKGYKQRWKKGSKK